MNRTNTGHACQGIGPRRRAFLSDMGLGFTGLALGAMLHRDGLASANAWSPPDGRPHFVRYSSGDMP